MRRPLLALGLALAVTFPTLGGADASACGNCQLGRGSQDVAVGRLMAVGGMGANPLHDGSSFEGEVGSDGMGAAVGNDNANFHGPVLIYGLNNRPSNAANTSADRIRSLDESLNSPRYAGDKQLDAGTVKIHGRIDSLSESQNSQSPDAAGNGADVTVDGVGDPSPAGFRLAPEPGALALLGLGLLAGFRYRRS